MGMGAERCKKMLIEIKNGIGKNDISEIKTKLEEIQKQTQERKET